jgi:hypothetical protein
VLATEFIGVCLTTRDAGSCVVFVCQQAVCACCVQLSHSLVVSAEVLCAHLLLLLMCNS